MELELMKERKDLLDILHDEKRDLLLHMLKNNMDATRRIRAMTETIIARAAYISLDGLDDEDEESCADCINFSSGDAFCSEEEDEDIYPKEDCSTDDEKVCDAGCDCCEEC
jgi:hypothetical protein